MFVRDTSSEIDEPATRARNANSLPRFPDTNRHKNTRAGNSAAEGCPLSRENKSPTLGRLQTSEIGRAKMQRLHVYGRVQTSFVKSQLGGKRRRKKNNAS